MGIGDILLKHRKTILDKAFDLIISTYPQQSQIFLKQKNKQFSNPIGYNTNLSIEQIIDNIIADKDIESFLPPLENIIQIRAVQDFTPSQAVGFIFLIKKVIYETLKTEVDTTELIELMSRIDSLALVAFDIFMKYRERLYNIKANELIERTQWILKKWNIITEIEDKIVETK